MDGCLVGHGVLKEGLHPAGGANSKMKRSYLCKAGTQVIRA